ncbi:MAG TPA: hypothetical protein PKZ75_06830 [Bacteroidia bacterium]|nr:hypothetical protein [Bacteroidia bacterium]
MACTLAHVPPRLHQLEKPAINHFEIGEEIYRRCTPVELENPFKGISICELSHNRQGLAGNIISQPQDALINITGVGENTYDKVVCTLVIRDINEQLGTYCKEFNQEKDKTLHNAKLQLIHEPDNCMYPHCVFRVWLDEELITYDNYNLVDKLKQIKTQLKSALASMIIQKQISQELT